jgi:hypothetical protein
VQLFKDLIVGDASRLSFMIGFSIFVSALGFLMMAGSGWYFLRKGPR